MAITASELIWVIIGILGVFVPLVLLVIRNGFAEIKSNFKEFEAKTQCRLDKLFTRTDALVSQLAVGEVENMKRLTECKKDCDDKYRTKEECLIICKDQK